MDSMLLAFKLGLIFPKSVTATACGTFALVGSAHGSVVSIFNPQSGISDLIVLSCDELSIRVVDTPDTKKLV